MEIISKIELHPCISIKLKNGKSRNEAVSEAIDRLATALDTIGEDAYYVIAGGKVYFTDEDGNQVDEKGNPFVETTWED